jgi:hypothetical protein
VLSKVAYLTLCRSIRLLALLARGDGAKKWIDRSRVLDLLAPFAAHDEVAKLFITAIADGYMFDRLKLPRLPNSGAAGQLSGLLDGSS